MNHTEWLMLTTINKGIIYRAFFVIIEFEKGEVENMKICDEKTKGLMVDGSLSIDKKILSLSNGFE